MQSLLITGVILTIVSTTNNAASAQEGKQVVNVDPALEIILSHVKHPIADRFQQQALDVYHELNDLFEVKFHSNSLLNDYIRNEFEFWVSKFGNYDSDKCTVEFERSLIDRRRNLIEFTLADTGSDAPVVTPKLDLFIQTQREKLLQECSRDLGTTLEDRIRQIAPPEYQRIQTLVDYKDRLSAICDHGTCIRRRFAIKLGDIIATQYIPPARSILKRLLQRQGSPEAQFDDLYEVNFGGPCKAIVDASIGSNLNAYVRYLEEFWPNTIEGLTKQWLRMRQFCWQYISNASPIKEKVFKSLPTALMKIGKVGSYYAVR